MSVRFGAAPVCHNLEPWMLSWVAAVSDPPLRWLCESLAQRPDNMAMLPASEGCRVFWGSYGLG